MGIGSGLSLHCFHGYMRAVKFDGKIILLKIIDWWKMEIFSKIYDAMMEQETNEDVVKIRVREVLTGVCCLIVPFFAHFNEF